MPPAPRRDHGPTALPKALSFEEVADHRNVSCGRYAMCLEVVVNRRWPSFSCQYCSLWFPACKRAAAGPARVLVMPLAGER